MKVPSPSFRSCAVACALLRVSIVATAGVCIVTTLAGHSSFAQSQPSSAKPVGTIKAISGNTITLASDSGADVSIIVQDGAKFVLVAPGQTSLKNAVPIQLSDLHPGDRILARGVASADGKSVMAVSVIAMAKTEIAAKQARERDEWQRHGISGLVLSSDASAGSIVISLPSLAEKKNVTVHARKGAVMRRYAPDSVKFDDAKPAPLEQIKPGDQLRARGVRTADGLEFNADEIVTGAFRNIAGTVISSDAAAGTLTVENLATKKPVTLKISPDSQLRKLPQPMAQRIAARLKGALDAAPGAGGASGSAQPDLAARPSPEATSPNGAGAQGTSRPGTRQNDLQQMISRMPAAALADLQKGDAVMIVATEGSSTVGPSVITLLAGVEPILQATPAGNASILSPWSLDAQGGEPTAP